MQPNTILERLRGTVRVPVKDGAGPLNGQDFFERSFPSSQLAKDAADRIEELQTAGAKVLDALNGRVHSQPAIGALHDLQAAIDKLNKHRS